jgi:hypothetical protein
MSEALRKPAPIIETPRLDPLADLLETPQPGNDNADDIALRHGDARAFEIPAAMWAMMIACYAVFLAALLAATGDAYAGFAIAISAFYVAMFFGTARALVGQAPEQARSPLARAGGKLQTLCGPLGRREVMAQMLVVPAAIALFGVAVLVIRLAVG